MYPCKISLPHLFRQIMNGDNFKNFFRKKYQLGTVSSNNTWHWG